MPPGKRHKGFKSKAQWRLFFANPRLRRYAHDKAHATKGGKGVRYKRLPERKGAPGLKTATHAKDKLGRKKKKRRMR